MRHQIGQTILLEGISLKGKNRVREHGSTWMIKDVWEQVSFSNIPGPWIRVEAADGNGRWIHISQDKDFRIIGG